MKTLLWLSIGRADDLERTLEIFIYDHHASSIIKLIAVIRGTENRHEGSVPRELVSVRDDLMRATDQV